MLKYDAIMKIILTFLLVALLAACSMQPVSRAPTEAFYTPQADWADCGAAVTVMMTQFAQRALTLQQAKKITGRHNWWWSTHIVSVLQRQGIRYSFAEQVELLQDDDIGMAVIIQYWPGVYLSNHFVFLRGMRNGLVKVHDPAAGTYWMSIPALEARQVKGFGLVVHRGNVS